MSATPDRGRVDTFVLDVGVFEMIGAEFELDIQVITDAAIGYAVQGCDTSGCPRPRQLTFRAIDTAGADIAQRPRTGERGSMNEAAIGTADPFDLDVSIVEGGEEVDVLLASTDNGCSSTCPNACTGTGVAQLC